MKQPSIIQAIVITAIMFIASLAISSPIQAETIKHQASGWAKYFKKYDAKGTIVVLDKRAQQDKTWVYDQNRAQQRYSPASTYKIPHSLFALDAGLVSNEFQVFAWDGVKRGYSPHNQDQNLRSAIRNSSVWVYDIFAKQLGEKKSGNYLNWLW